MPDSASTALPASAPSPKRRYDVVFCDVDGCLMPEHQAGADLSALAQIADHNARAFADRDRPVVVPCTGRPQPYAEAISRLLGGSGDVPAICEHGVWLFDFANNRWERDPAIEEGHINALRDLERWVEHELGPQGCFLQLGKHACVTIFHDNVEWLARTVVPMLHTVIDAHGWPFRVSMTWTCINVDLNFVSKASAIDRVIARCNLDPARLAGIGDTMGDLAIRERVAWFGCPANAQDELKEHADMVSEHAEAAGALDLLNRLCSRDGAGTPSERDKQTYFSCSFPTHIVRLSTRYYTLYEDIDDESVGEVAPYDDWLMSLRDMPSAIEVGKVPPPSVHHVTHEPGRAWTDLLIGSPNAYSERFFEALTVSGATGWSKYLVEIDDADVPQKYYGLIVTDTEPTIEPIRQSPDCSGDLWCMLPFPLYRRRDEHGSLSKNPDSPMVADFVVVPTTHSFLVSDRVRIACEHAGLTGMRFTPVGWIQHERVPGEQTLD